MLDETRHELGVGSRPGASTANGLCEVVILKLQRM